MNSFRLLSRTSHDMFIPLTQHSNKQIFKNKISTAISTAFSSLQFSFEKARKQLADRIKEVNSPIIPSPSALEDSLETVCSYPFSDQNRKDSIQSQNPSLIFEEEHLIKLARNLIKQGARISPLFESCPGMLTWLREHCAEELRERAAISKTGLELIDFETMLPSGWQPSEWLSKEEKLEVNIIQEDMHRIDLNSPQVETSEIEEKSDETKSTCDLQRLHVRALQNPIYEALWKKLETSSPTIFELAPISVFLRPGMSENDVSKAHYNSDRKKIQICQGMPEQITFEYLIFESVNAYQDKRLTEVFRKKERGEIGKEDYARSIEYIEWGTIKIYHQIMDFGSKNLGWKKNKFTKQLLSFAKTWESSNERSSPNKKNSHTDIYRYQWDQLRFLYFIRHPEMAPSKEDWLNTIPDNELSPLVILACIPHIALLWEKDPFIQLIDKGASINNDLIAYSCHVATHREYQFKTEYTAIHVVRIRKLLDLGLSIPDGLSTEENAWLKAHVFKKD